MILNKKCLFCKELFDNIRKDGKHKSSGLFGRVKFCSMTCSFKHKFKPNLFRFEDEKCFILLENMNIETVIDKGLYYKVKDYRWYQDSVGYAATHKKKNLLRLHELIMGKKKKFVIDHIDRNQLNNVGSNLRHVSHRINILNQGDTSKNNSTGYKGVGFDKKKGKWRAYIQDTHLGWFKSLEEAIKIRDQSKKELFKHLL